MINITPWFTRKFTQIEDNGLFPGILERLRGTPERLKASLDGLTQDTLTSRWNDKWSIQEEAGHLLDLESLWYGRFEDFQEGKTVLRAADLSNTKTHEANHNQNPIQNIIKNFSIERNRIMEVLDTFSITDLEKTALHPRLKTPMRIIDLTFFIAEHDDHHLARIMQIKKMQS